MYAYDQNNVHDMTEATFRAFRPNTIIKIGFDVSQIWRHTAGGWLVAVGYIRIE